VKILMVPHLSRRVTGWAFEFDPFEETGYVTPLNCEKNFGAGHVPSGFDLVAPALVAFTRVGGFSIFSRVRTSLS
jgi:hypothetical protein